MAEIVLEVSNPNLDIGQGANPELNLDSGCDPSDIRAKIWAEGTDEQVQALGGQHSSKGWAEITDEKVSAYPTHYEFPNVGKKNCLYIAEEEDACYRWDVEKQKYFIVGEDVSKYKVVNGGKA